MKGHVALVMERSKMDTPISMLVLLTLADFMDRSESGEAFPSQATLAKRCRCTDRAVRDALKKAVAAGEIEEVGTSATGTIIWTLTIDREAGGRNTVPGGSEHGSDKGSSTNKAPRVRTVGATEKGSAQQRLLQDDGPEPSVPQQRVPRGEVDGHSISPDEWAMAEALLDRFNELSGKRFSARTTKGRASPMIKPIIMRIREHPEIPLDEHLDILDRNFANPWWKGELRNTRVIYSPAAFDGCRVNEGVAKRPATTRSSTYARPVEDKGPGW